MPKKAKQPYHRFVRPAPPFESAPEPNTISGGGRSRMRGGAWYNKVLGAVGRIGGAAAGAYMGGPYGMMAGSEAGGSLADLVPDPDEDETGEKQEERAYQRSLKRRQEEEAYSDGRRRMKSTRPSMYGNGRSRPMRGGRRLVTGAGIRRASAMRGGANEMILQKKHVGFGKKRMAGGAMRKAGSMLRGGAEERSEFPGGAPPQSVMESGTSDQPPEIGGNSSGALGVGQAMMQMQQINPRPQQYGGPNVQPMRLMVDHIQMGRQ